MCHKIGHKHNWKSKESMEKNYQNGCTLTKVISKQDSKIHMG